MAKNKHSSDAVDELCRLLYNRPARPTDYELCPRSQVLRDAVEVVALRRPPCKKCGRRTNDYKNRHDIPCSVACWFESGAPKEGAPNGKVGVVCITCHAPFTVSARKYARGKHKKHCCRSCWKAQSKIKEHKCNWCNKEYRPKVNDRDTYCSRECYFAYKAEQAKATAQFRKTKARVLKALRVQRSIRRARRLCDTDGCSRRVSSRITKVTSCPVCRERQYLEKAREERRKTNRFGVVGDKIDARCQDCGCDFVFIVTQGRIPNRCDKCRAQRAREANKISGCHRKRAKKHGVAHELVNPSYIYERDKWTCGICGKRIPQDVHYLDDLAPTLDHIVPVSKGGPHLRHNIQAAHRECNSNKGNRSAGSQMIIPMFG